MPVVVDDDARVTLPESTIIIEYLDRYGEAPPLVPADPEAVEPYPVCSLFILLWCQPAVNDFGQVRVLARADVDRR